MPKEDQQQTPSPTSIGKGMHEDPTHGHRQVTEAERAEALSTKGSFDSNVKADPAPAGAMTPEAIMSMDNLPDDPKEIEALLGQTFGDKSRETKPEGDAPAHQMAEALQRGEATAAAAEAPKQKESQQETKSASTEPPAAATEEGEFVESRDGKSRIPYAVLAGTRRELAETNRQLAEARALIDQLKTSPAPGEAPATAAATEHATAAAAEAEAGTLTEQDISELREQFPEKLVDIIEKLNASARTANEKVREIEHVAQQEAAAEIHDMAQSVQDIIDQDPVLTKIQQNADDWSEAVKIDDALRQERRWKDKPPIERFAEVKRRMGFEVTEAPQPTAEERAAAKLATAATKQQKEQPARGFTHSDLPGGQPPAQSERERVSSLSTMDIANMFDKMTPAQQTAYLAQIG